MPRALFEAVFTSSGGFGVAGALLGGLARSGKILRRVDQRHVRKRLWEIADQPSCSRIVFFREQPEVVADREQPVE